MTSDMVFSVTTRQKKDLQMSPKTWLSTFIYCRLKITKKIKEKPNLMFNWLLIFKQERVFPEGMYSLEPM